MNSRLALILLALMGTASAADRCTELATLAANIAEAREQGVPQEAVASQLRAQYREGTDEQRDANAMTERVIVVVYESDKEPAALRQEVQERCDAGEFDRRRRVTGPYVEKN